ncbi:MAG: hypothetical protein IKX84_03180, partial [Clostridia bacterium]|nr:hypothetical protein [Clostridia bacterium]
MDTFDTIFFRDVNLLPIPATGSQFFLRFLRKSPGEKTAMQRFLLSAGKLTFAKIAPRAGK